VISHSFWPRSGRPAGRGTPPGQRRRHPAPPTTAPRSSPSKAKAASNAAWPIEGELLSVSETYLNSRAIRVPDAVKRKGAAVGVWPATVARWVSAIRRAQRRTHHTWNAAIALERAFKRAGPDAQPVLGALVHGLRHTYATELAGSDVSVYTLMKLLGHESMTTSQRHVAAAGTAPIVPQRKTRSMSSSGHIVDLINKVTTVAVEVTKTVRRRTVFSSAQPIP
jgi:integrase